MRRCGDAPFLALRHLRHLAGRAWRAWRAWRLALGTKPQLLDRALGLGGLGGLGCGQALSGLSHWINWWLFFWKIHSNMEDLGIPPWLRKPPFHLFSCWIFLRMDTAMHVAAASKVHLIAFQVTFISWDLSTQEFSLSMFPYVSCVSCVSPESQRLYATLSQVGLCHIPVNVAAAVPVVQSCGEGHKNHKSCLL